MAFIVTNEVSYFKFPIVWVNLWEDFCPNVLIDDRRRFCANDLKIVIAREINMCGSSLSRLERIRIF